MNQAPTYISPFINVPNSRGDHSLWEEAKSHFEKKEYDMAFEKTLEYCYGKTIPKKIGEGITTFTLPHNKTTVHITIKNGTYFVKVPFIKMPLQNALGILRKTAEVNFHPCTLNQIILREDQCFMEYESFMEHCEPEKLHNLLEEMCYTFDFHTPIFQENFGATLVEERAVEAFPKEKMDEAWELYQKTLEEGLDLYHEFEKKRELYNCWDILNITLKKIDFFLSPKGLLRSHLIQTIEEMQQKDTALNKVLEKTLMQIEKLKNLQRSQFDASFYLSEKLFHYKAEREAFFTKNFFDEVHKIAKEEQNKANFKGLTIYLTYALYDFLYRNIAPAPIVKIIQNALQKSSHKPWNEASDILWEAMNDLRQEKTYTIPSGPLTKGEKQQMLYIYLLIGGLVFMGFIVQLLRRFF